jgi:hypothetical protein
VDLIELDAFSTRWIPHVDIQSLTSTRFAGMYPIRYVFGRLGMLVVFCIEVAHPLGYAMTEEL